MEFINLQKPHDSLDINTIMADFKAGTTKAGDTVKLKGYIHRIRKMSDFAFVIIRTPRILVQCIYEPDKANFDLNDIAEESCVVVEGTLVDDERSKLGFEIHITGIEVLSAPAELSPIVINKKKLDCNIDVNLDYRPISLRNPNERAVLKIQDGIICAFTTFLRSEGFTEFVPPKIVSAGAEGGADMFEVNYFGQKAFLNQSPQMYKQMMVGVFNKVFTVSPVFRAEKHSTSRHINEFQGLDLEMGFIDSFEDVMAVEARLMVFLFNFLNENYAQELEELKITLPEITQIPQVKFMDIKQIVAEKYKRKFRDPNDLEPDEERLIGKYFMDEFNCPFVFVTHYPSKKRPFYAMDDPADPKYTLSFDLLLNGSEITTGGQRIHDYNMQIEKMKARGMDIEDFKDYLMIHKYGMPPHGGLGLGLERLTMKLLNLDNIRKATAFPRDTGRLNP